MPDRIYSLEPGRDLVYDVAFKRKSPDLHAVRSSDPAVHTCRVRVKLEDEKTLSVALDLGGPSRRVEHGDTLLAVCGAAREIAAEADPDAVAKLDLATCALVFKLRE